MHAKVACLLALSGFLLMAFACTDGAAELQAAHLGKTDVIVHHIC